VAAVASRARATAAGVAPALLAGGDSVVSAAELMADSGKHAEAAALFSTAAALWDSIPVAEAPAPVVSAPQTITRQPEPEAAPPPTDSSQIVSYYRELALGIQARQLGEVRRLLPNLARFAEDTWRRLFEDDGVERIEANFQVLNLTRSGDQVHARVQESVVVTKSGRSNPKNRTFFATLTLGPQGWRQIREEKTS
jgi:hypothetical protein